MDSPSDSGAALPGPFAVSRCDAGGEVPDHDDPAHQLEALLEGIPDLIYFKDRDSRFVRCSRALLDRFRLKSPPDVRGKSDFDFISREDAVAAYDEEQEIIRSGKPMIGRIHTRTLPDGGVVWRLTSKMPWRDHDGRIIGTLGVTKDITDIRRAEMEVERLHRQLLDASRQAGMAEVAESVLHGVGNALNSVSVSGGVVLERIRNSKVAGLVRLAEMLREHGSDLGRFLTEDPKGRQVGAYIASLAGALVEERRCMEDEMERLRRHVAHIEEIVAMQRRYARVGGMPEPVCVADVVDDALRVHAGTLAESRVAAGRDFTARPVLTLERHKLLHVFVHLVENARAACVRAGRPDGRLIVRVVREGPEVRVEFADNGAGFSPADADALFAQGTDADGDGPRSADLHTAALIATELGGTLIARSAGPGRGASFVLKLATGEATPDRAGA